MSNYNEKVSIIGLGLMGSALAGVLLREGYRVTVWNRTPEKADGLIKKGALLAPSAALAIGSSPTVIICVADYEASRSLLSSKETAPFLPGKTVIELSTGTPQEARDAQVWAKEHGIDYLDGAIMATPSQMGRPETLILASGPRSVFDKSEAVLKALAGGLAFLGEAVGNASAVDFAILSFWFGGNIGFLHGVRICEAEGFPVRDFAAMTRAIAPFAGESNEKMAERIFNENYDDSEASVRTCAAALKMIARHASEAGISSEFPDYAYRFLERGMDAGFGEEDLAAAIKIMRTSSAATTAG